MNSSSIRNPIGTVIFHSQLDLGAYLLGKFGEEIIPDSIKEIFLLFPQPSAFYQKVEFIKSLDEFTTCETQLTLFRNDFHHYFSCVKCLDHEMSIFNSFLHVGSNSIEVFVVEVTHHRNCNN